MKSKYMIHTLRLAASSVLIVSILAIGGCGLLKKQTLDEPFLEFEKTACFGNCPIYVMQFYPNGIVKLDGKQFMDKLGLYELQLDKNEVATIEEELESMGFCSMESLYGSNAMDFPSTFLRYECNDEVKIVEAVTDFPEELLEFIQRIDQLRKRQDWVATGANETSN